MVTNLQKNKKNVTNWTNFKYNNTHNCEEIKNEASGSCPCDQAVYLITFVQCKERVVTLHSTSFHTIIIWTWIVSLHHRFLTEACCIEFELTNIILTLTNNAMYKQHKTGFIKVMLLQYTNIVLKNNNKIKNVTESVFFKEGTV